eukprot:CAMPEP_0174711466 /NCGR_PEP_ID=MMETSP1094-20130205/12780_1 /TAXON_ID=156173 /ORGANISM="Chrysochromulina brevifilum, Strain UTEX LB 985" /LENGTH=45 /DNA_ID= /DNA_START= /DNA_END= /DNA_ORIENTATION=
MKAEAHAKAVKAEAEVVRAALLREVDLQEGRIVQMVQALRVAISE